MARTLNDVIKGLPFNQQREIEAKSMALIEELTNQILTSGRYPTKAAAEPA